MLALSVGVALAAFGLVALALVAVGTSGRDVRELWHFWGAELLLVGWIGIPALLGGAAWLAMLGLTGLAVGRELVGLLRGRPAPDLAIALLPGCGLVALGILGLGPNGFGDAVFLFAVVELHDTTAFVVGRLACRTPLAPRLSPRKTREGAAAGLGVAALVGAVLAPLIPGLGVLEGAGVGLGLGGAALAVDLGTSAWKRRRGVKDFAQTLPLHGSVLDVYDSLLGTAPLWALALWWTR